jgi:hypothetical protein
VLVSGLGDWYQSLVKTVALVIGKVTERQPRSQPVTEWWRVFFAGLYFQFCLRSSERTGNSGLSPPLRTRFKCASQNPRALAGRKQPATLHFFHFDKREPGFFPGFFYSLEAKEPTTGGAWSLISSRTAI